jgi:hypothetical protein
MESQAMAHARYFVTPHAGHWRVSLESRTMGEVATKDQAINSAIVMADLMGNMGHDADVMLDDGEKLAVIWTYGESMFRGSRPRKIAARYSRSRSHVKHAAVPV